MILTQEYSRVANVKASQRVADDYSQRAWLVSPQGKVILCGGDHRECQENQEVLKGLGITGEFTEQDEYEWEDRLQEKGWGKIGSFGQGLAYVDIKNMTEAMFESIWKLLFRFNLHGDGKVVITWRGREYSIYWEDFKGFESLKDLNQHIRYMGFL